MGIFDWIFGKKETSSDPEKKIKSDDNNSEMFNSLNKSLGTNLKQSDYTIPIELLEKIDDLIYLENKLYSGFVTIETFDNGRPKKIMEIKKGIEEGGFKEYWLNGKIKIDSNIKNRKIHGKNKEYFQNGNLHLEGNFNNGKEDGLHKEYFEDGTLFREILFKNGEEVVGPKEEGTIEDFLQKERFLDYHENGKLSLETEIKNGIPHGLGKSWDENGILKNEIVWENGIPIKSTWYHSNGTPKKQHYDDENGKIISKCWDEYGNEVKCE